MSCVSVSFPSSIVMGIFLIIPWFLSSVNRFTVAGGSSPDCSNMSLFCSISLVLPSLSFRPLFIIIMRSANSGMASVSCVDIIMVVPFLLSSFRVSINLRREVRSRLAVGSSRISSSGFRMRAVARVTFFFSPKLNLCGGRCFRCVMFIFSSMYVLCVLMSWSGSFRFLGPYSMSSITLGVKSWSSGSWKTMPMRLRVFWKVFEVVFSLKTVMSPEFGVRRPAMSSINVDLPEPFGPSNAMRSPLVIWRDMPFMAAMPVG